MLPLCFGKIFFTLLLVFGRDLGLIISLLGLLRLERTGEVGFLGSDPFEVGIPLSPLAPPLVGTVLDAAAVVGAVGADAADTAGDSVGTDAGAVPPPPPPLVLLPLLNDFGGEMVVGV